MTIVFLYNLWASAGISVDSVDLREDDCAELDQKLLKSMEIQVLCFSLLQQFHIQISHKVSYFFFAGQEKQFEILQHLNQLHHM